MSSGISNKLGTGLALAVIASTCAVLAPLSPVAAGSASDCAISTPSAAYDDQVASSARHAQTWRLYQAYFLRQPDAAGLNYWIDVSVDGASHVDIAREFELSQEFKNRYGELNNDAFLELIYANVLCRIPDEIGFGYWLGFLDSGEMSRPEMLIYFAESAEYITITETAWSVFDDPNAATLEENGYEIQPIPGGTQVAVDYSRIDFKASHERCSIASINGNWFFTPSQPNPVAIGFGVIGGQEIAWQHTSPPGPFGADRGVLGERYRSAGPTAERVYDYDGTHVNSNLGVKDGVVLESWLGFQPPEWNVPSREVAGEWKWAAAGIPLIVNGQIWQGIYPVQNTYTHQRGGHSFVAMDTDTGTLYFGSVAGRTSVELISWAASQGYEDLIKFDGGGSVELNVGGGAVIGGTSRDVPLWLGIGC